MGDFFVSVTDLAGLLDSNRHPLLYDVRKPQAYAQSGETIPGAVWRDHTQTDGWAREIPAGTLVVVYCVHGHEVSQGAGKALRELGLDARVLDGGFEAWCTSRGATVPAPKPEKT